MDLLENCSECYQFNLSEFPETIIIQGHLTPATQYYFKFTDKFGNSYITDLVTAVTPAGITAIQVITEGLNLTSFIEPIPSPAWFNKNAGKFTIEASLTTDAWIPVDFTFDSVAYQCIVVEFFNDNSERNTIL